MQSEASNIRAEDRQPHRRSHTRPISPSGRSRTNNRGRYRDRDRSRSPSRRHHRRSHSPGHSSKHDKKHRERRHHRHRRNDLSPVSAAPPILPYNARQLSKRDLSQLEPMFAMYLDIQKGLVIEDLDEEEVMGRWKSFIKKWNRGELSEGWYDPATFEKAKNNFNNERPNPNRHKNRDSPSLEQPEIKQNSVRNDKKGGVSTPEDVDVDDEDDDAYGPKFPHAALTSRGLASGPTIPNLQDLELQREQALADFQTAHSAAHVQHKHDVLSHKTHLRAFEDEVAPRAEPGTHERKMEKRKETAVANREFARRGSPTMDAAPDSELMGGGAGDDLENLKRVKEQEIRKKNEREIRREEVLRARKAEREERLAEYKKKEEETMGWLKALAKERFG